METKILVDADGADVFVVGTMCLGRVFRDLLREWADKTLMAGSASSRLGCRRLRGDPRRRSVMYPFRPKSIDEPLAACTPGVRRLVQADAQTHSRRRTGSYGLRPGWGVIGCAAYFSYVLPMQDHVRVGLERGVAIPDPENLLEEVAARCATFRSGGLLAPLASPDLLRVAATIGPPRRRRRR